MGLFDKLKKRKEDKERRQREFEEYREMKKTQRPLTIPMEELVKFFNLQDEKNIFLDVCLFTVDGITHRSGMQISEVANKAVYAFDEEEFETLEEMIEQSLLSNYEQSITLLGWEVYTEKYVVECDIRMEPYFQDLENKMQK